MMVSLKEKEMWARKLGTENLALEGGGVFGLSPMKTHFSGKKMLIAPRLLDSA